MKYRLLCCGAAMLLLLTGCSADGWMAHRVLDLAGVSKSEDYQTYEELAEQGRLDKEGHYQSPDVTEIQEQAQAHEGMVRVTFGRNSKLEVSYFYDAEQNKPVDSGNCWLKPGESIYSSEPVSRSKAEPCELDVFRISQYDELGEKSLFLEQEWEADKPVLTVPADFSAAELSVEPISRAGGPEA